MGIHPWYIKNESISEEIIELKMNSTKQNILAIGECGLDRFCETPYKLQQEIFKQQIIWANEIAKPLIIHSVRTYDDVLQTLKDNKNIMPVIFHGFNKNKIIAQKIIASGHYISFGKDVSKSELETVIASVPLDKIFLETDESDLPIEFIYKEFSRIRNIPLSQLILQTNKNLKTVFKI
jgi:TatD DNase family protein